ncbi:MAG TPA: HEPN domain-containing protein [Armatimonadetes bacterium]|nr:HEPN domain-containing protein [Armatimonadota bacterium]
MSGIHQGAADKSMAREVFIQRLLRSEVGDRILRILHYGSTRRGDWHPESDVDLLVIASGDLRQVQQTCSDLAFEVILEQGQRIEAMVYCLEEWRNPRHFLSQVQTYAQEVYAVDENTRRQREAEDLLDLAQVYLTMAEQLQNAHQARGAVDLAYNAAELAAKGLILLQGEELPRTHSGLVTHCGELLVRSGTLPSEMGRGLNRLLDQRNRARYDPHATLLPEDGETALALARQMIEALEMCIESGL